MKDWLVKGLEKDTKKESIAFKLLKWKTNLDEMAVEVGQELIEVDVAVLKLRQKDKGGKNKW